MARSARPGKGKQDDALTKGTSIDVEVYRADDGQLFLDAKVELSRNAAPESPNKKSTAQLLAATLARWLQPKTEEKTGVRLITHGLRIVEPVTLGKKITVSLGKPSEKSRFEVRVSEASANDLAVLRNKPGS
ncbi:MAG: hypothetical protein ABFD16_23160 [Thermoguttaceae bacterium]